VPSGWSASPTNDELAASPPAGSLRPRPKAEGAAFFGGDFLRERSAEGRPERKKGPLEPLVRPRLDLVEDGAERGALLGEGVVGRDGGVLLEAAVDEAGVLEVVEHA